MGGKLFFSGWMLSGIEMSTIPELVSQALGSFLISETAPTGLWLAMKHPERVTAIATQDGNAYLEALARSGSVGRPFGGIRRAVPRIAER